MIVCHKDPDKDHKFENRLEFPHLNALTRLRYFENHQFATQPQTFLKSLPCEDVSKKECYSWLKHISLLVSLNHHRRTNNNRIINISQLVLLTCLAFMTLLTLSTTAEAKKNASLEFDNLNAKAVQLHESSSSVLIPMQTSVSYSTAYSDSRLPPGFNKNKKRPGTVRNVSKFRKNLSRKNATNNANNPSLDVLPEKVINDRSTIARPFFTKITSTDAVAKPSTYFESIFKLPTLPLYSSTSRPESSTLGSNATSKPSKLFTIDKTTAATGLTSATEKSFLTTSTVRNNNDAVTEADSGPKIRLEPFFNLFNNIQSFAFGTSKEKNFSPSYQTIEESISENTKKSKANKSTKGMREKKKRKKLRNKAPKLDGPIPIPLPEQVVDTEELNNSHFTVSRSTNKSTLHPMDVLNIPMNPNPSTSENAFTQIPSAKGDLLLGREAMDSYTSFSMDDARNSTFDSTRGYVGFNSDKHANESKDDFRQSPNEGEGRLRSGSIIDNFHDQDVDLQAEESVTMLQMDPSPTPMASTNTSKKRKKHRRKGSRANIPSGYTIPTDIDAAYSFNTQQKSDPQRQYSNNEFNPIPGPPSLHYLPASNTQSRIRDDLTMISKYPISFDYNPGMYPEMNQQSGNRPTFSRIPQNNPRITNHGPPNQSRPSLNSYYDPNYHKYTAHETNGFPVIANDYVHPHAGGSHYVGFPHGGHDAQGNIVIPPQTIPSKPSEATSDLQSQGSSSDNTYDPEVDVDKTTNSNQKIGIMDSFDLFYTNYKILTWAAFFVVTSLALLALLVYLYVNNPPTEVVQARESYFSLDNLLANPQILKFLSSLVESNQSHRSGRQKRKKFKNDSMQSTTNKIKKQL